MAITDWPSNERPREKLMNKGAAALSNAELIAIFLRTGIKGKSAVDLARDMLKEFGSLRALFEMGPSHFCKRPGLGMAKYVHLQAVVEMNRRYLQEIAERGDAIRNPNDINQFLISKLRNYQQEVVACLFLDNHFRILHYEELFFGTINCSTIHPREIIKRALHYNAAAIIFAHNHPSGIAEPSTADKQMTLQLKNALQWVDIKLLDHIIIGDGQIFSFATQHLL